MEDVNKNTIAVIACAKQEELYICEWIEWNINIGVDHIFICDNNDSNYKVHESKLLCVAHNQKI